MNEIIDSLIVESQIGIGELIFLSVFLLGTAFFKTVILRGLYGWEYKPKWFLFALEPAVLFLVWSIKPNFTHVVLVCSFLLTFVLAILGFMISPLVIKLKYTRTRYQKSGKSFTLFTVSKVTIFYLLSTAGMFVGLALFQISLPLVLLFLFILLPLFLLINPGGDRHFIDLQAILPTSPIRSVAMGLAEVEGNTVMGKPLIAPINNIACIAYQYKIEDISRDSEGRDVYTTIHDEKRCNSFSIQDKTGILEVTPERLNFLRLPINNQFQKKGKRYTQQLLLPGEKVLLVGMADTKGGKTIFRYEEVKGVYALMPSQSLSKYNRARPLINRFVLYTSLFGIITSLILLCDIA